MAFPVAVLSFPARYLQTIPWKPGIPGCVRELSAGFGLEPFMLSRLFSPSKHDRSGFWRAFESDPLALPVVERALAVNA